MKGAEPNLPREIAARPTQNPGAKALAALEAPVAPGELAASGRPPALGSAGDAPVRSLISFDPGRKATAPKLRMMPMPVQKAMERGDFVSTRPRNWTAKLTTMKPTVPAALMRP